MTGYCGLGKHLHNKGIYAEEPICKLSDIAEKDATRIIVECKKFDFWRNTMMVDDLKQTTTGILSTLSWSLTFARVPKKKLTPIQKSRDKRRQRV